MSQKHHVMHGRDHLPEGADPIPGLVITTVADTYEEAVRVADLTAWWRLGDTFTFGSSVADAMIDTADFDADSPRNLTYIENSSTDRPTLQVANSTLGDADDGAVEFTATSFSDQHRFSSTSTENRAVTEFGTSGDKARTLSLWLKPKSGSGNTGPVVGRWGMDPTDSFQLGWLLELNQTSYVLSFKVDATDVLTGPTLTPGTWYHVAITYDGTTYRMYLDGLFVDDLTASAPTDPNAHMFAIGYGVYDSGVTSQVRLFHGSVDDIAFYKRVLTVPEIEAIASGGTEATPTTVTSLSAAGEALLVGDVTLSEGANITLTQSGQDIQIAAAPGDPADATTWWFPLFDSDGTAVLDGSGNIIPTLIPL